MKSLPANTRKYIIIGVAVIIVALLIYLFFVIVGGNSGLNSAGTLSASLENPSISTNGSTGLLVSVKNTGRSRLDAHIKVTPDDAQAVQVSYPETDLLQVSLLPEESITRRILVQGFSKAIRTDYQLKVELLSDNETLLAQRDVVLTVKK